MACERDRPPLAAARRTTRAGPCCTPRRASRRCRRSRRTRRRARDRRDTDWVRPRRPVVDVCGDARARRSSALRRRPRACAGSCSPASEPPSARASALACSARRRAAATSKTNGFALPPTRSAKRGPRQGGEPGRPLGGGARRAPRHRVDAAAARGAARSGARAGGTAASSRRGRRASRSARGRPSCTRRVARPARRRISHATATLRRPHPITRSGHGGSSGLDAAASSGKRAPPEPRRGARARVAELLHLGRPAERRREREALRVVAGLVARQHPDAPRARLGAGRRSLTPRPPASADHQARLQPDLARQVVGDEDRLEAVGRQLVDAAAEVVARQQIVAAETACRCSPRTAPACSVWRALDARHLAERLRAAPAPSARARATSRRDRTRRRRTAARRRSRGGTRRGGARAGRRAARARTAASTSGSSASSWTARATAKPPSVSSTPAKRISGKRQASDERDSTPLPHPTSSTVRGRSQRDRRIRTRSRAREPAALVANMASPYCHAAPASGRGSIAYGLELLPGPRGVVLLRDAPLVAGGRARATRASAVSASWRRVLALLRATSAGQAGSLGSPAAPRTAPSPRASRPVDAESGRGERCERRRHAADDGEAAAPCNRPARRGCQPAAPLRCAATG